MSPSSQNATPGGEAFLEANHGRGSANTCSDSIVETISSEETLEDVGALETKLSGRISQMSDPYLARELTSGTGDPEFEVDWESDEDPANPRNWSLAYKSLMVFFISWNTLIVVLYSTSYTPAVSELTTYFGTSETIMTLGLTFYLLGLAFGSLVMAPLSEMYGRKPVCVPSLFLFAVLIIPCARATSVAEIMVVRFLSAFFGSVMVSAAPGLVADVVNDEHRSLAISIWSIGPMNGPAGVALFFACIMRETYAPIILQRKAARLRKETGDSRWWSQYDNKMSLFELLKISLMRPFGMIVSEPICIFWNLYVGVVYGILYLCFVAYPIVFREIRGWSLGISGLGFLGIGIGIFITIACEPLIRRMVNAHKSDPETGKPPPEAMVSIICISSILIPVGELWFAWTCSPKSIHWIVPILAGVPFGAGNTGVFIYSASYLAGSYRIYSASALAANSVVRSILGGVMPLAGSPMYSRLDANWAGTLLGLLEVILIPIPFVFWKYGHKIRMKSPVIMKMEEDERKAKLKRENRWRRQGINVGDSEKQKETV
ncbi:hypothetical protein MPDQ_006615 [Monascus purpureus]|uniref:Major facilitator superfamily (MFS) profile domain-containing protein n=1 Tax=Monascus purpureus TaxID=5098 RepID=A0A507R6C8_MONPU|nr:hypothetical protein MPDQ_006615 [Monascus purpureus]